MLGNVANLAEGFKLEGMRPLAILVLIRFVQIAIAEARFSGGGRLVAVMPLVMNSPTGLRV